MSRFSGLWVLCLHREAVSGVGHKSGADPTPNQQPTYSVSMPDVSAIFAWIDQLITAQLFVSLHVLIIMVHVILVGVAYLIWWERKLSAYIQDRLGPNRTGFDFGFPILSFLKGMWGLGQPLADGLKFLLKEDYQPPAADKWLFTLAPIVIIVPALIGFAIIPWGGEWIIPDLTIPLIGISTSNLPIVGDITGPVLVAGANVNVGIAYLLAVGSLGVYGVTLGGWAGNNKYSFLGGLRATAQMISYELPMGLAIMVVLLTTGTVIANEIVNHQIESTWLIFAHPVAAVIFFVCVLAESNRAPFDNAEAEQELVGGYHTEYSAMRFAMFFLAEYAHMVTGAAFFTMLFLGGWSVPLPFIELPMVSEGIAGILFMTLKVAIFFGKAYLICLFMMVVRWTLPRIRYDQIMFLGWQTLIPTTLALVVMTSVLVYLQWTDWWQTLIANVVFAGGLLLIASLTRRPVPNRRTPMYGSRFSPAEGTLATTQSSDPLALEDRPVEGTVSTA